MVEPIKGSLAWKRAMAEVVLLDLGFLGNAIVTVVTATISGIILLYIHHRKVKQEIEIQAKREQFKSRVKVYRDLLKFIDRIQDFGLKIVADLDWYHWRTVRSELQLVGSVKVLEAVNDIVDTMHKMGDEGLTERLRDLQNTIRAELFPGEPLPKQSIRFVEPAGRAKEALQVYNENYETLLKAGVGCFLDLKNSDVAQLSQATGISSAVLRMLKEEAELEAKRRVQEGLAI